MTDTAGLDGLQPSVVHQEVATVVAGLEAELIAVRRDLHAHPETAWDEHRTTGVLLDRMRSAGLPAVVGPTGTGVLCDLGALDDDGPIIAVRADIDALWLPDTKDVPYRSTVDGVCHACGHDLHAAATLGAALALAEVLADGAGGRVRVIFQPAEETVPGGAVALVAEGVMAGVHATFAFHADPSLDVGRVGVSAGPITSAADQVDIRLHGPGGHTGRPHQTADLVHIAGRVITDLPLSLGRLSDPRDGLNLTFGSVQAGHAPNVVPTEARLLGSLRSSGRGAWEAAPAHIERILAGIIDPLGARWELIHSRGAPPIVNDPWAVGAVTRAGAAVVGPDHVGPTAQSAGGEDFSWYGDHSLLGYFRLGVHRPGRLRTDIHSSSFDIDEGAVALGARVLAGAALEALADLAHGPDAAPR
jgi:amidohydrolase